jgi:guanylate kinase
MSKCVVIVGPTASGKTSLARYLEMNGFRRIVTYTTRPPRKGEINGIDYHFISLEVFDQKEADNFFAETTDYHEAFGYCKYGSAKRDYQSLDKTCIILNPRGAMSLNTSPWMVWLDIPDDILVNRAVARGDSIEEVKRRIEEDKPDFERFKMSFLYDMQFTEELPIETMAKEIINMINS